MEMPTGSDHRLQGGIPAGIATKERQGGVELFCLIDHLLHANENVYAKPSLVLNIIQCDLRFNRRWPPSLRLRNSWNPIAMSALCRSIGSHLRGLRKDFRSSSAVDATYMSISVAMTFSPASPYSRRRSVNFYAIAAAAKPPKNKNA